jgi:hypothetical protein
LVYIFCGRFGTFFLNSGNPALSCFEFLCCVFISRKESTKGEQIAAIELPDKKSGLGPVLPDGLFSNLKYQFWQNLEGLGMENVVIFCDHLEYFTAIWYDLWPCV